MCEGRLATKVNKALESEAKLSIENAESEVKFTVVDFNFIMGAAIDREVNF